MSWILNYIDPFVMILSLFVGLTYTYFTTPPPRVVIKYPTPFNIDKTTYVDENNVCYKYKIKEVQCPRNSSQITYVMSKPKQTHVKTKIDPYQNQNRPILKPKLTCKKNDFIENNVINAIYGFETDVLLYYLLG